MYRAGSYRVTTPGTEPKPSVSRTSPDERGSDAGGTGDVISIMRRLHEPHSVSVKLIASSIKQQRNNATNLSIELYSWVESGSQVAAGGKDDETTL